jgi:broad specificity phosphatase PhoE
LETTVFLIRHGVTDWHAARKVLGHKDTPLNDEGRFQAAAASEALAGVSLGEILSSPLQRAIQTAEIIGSKFNIEIARDPRLIDFQAGRWSGMTHGEISASPEYQAFLANPSAERIPGGESLEEIRRRSVAAIEQALADNPSGDGIAVVSHAGVIRVLLAHYLGSPPANYHRIRVAPGSVSILSFADDRVLPRVLAVNALGKIARVLDRPGQ